MRKTISKLLCMVTVLAVVLSMMPAAMVSAAYTERLPRVTVHLLGDSTVTSYAKNSNTGITGWGQALEALLNEYVTVNNWAISGLSTKGMLQNLGQNKAEAYEEQWTGILRNIDAGDYVFIQFGHNDQASDQVWYSTIDEYKENLKRMVDETKSKGAIPVLVTSPERMYYSTQGETLGGYPAAMIEVAGNDTLLIDLNKYSKQVIFWSHPSEKLANNPFSPGEHYVLAAGISENGKILIANSSMRSAAKNGIQFTDPETIEKVLFEGCAPADLTWGRYPLEISGGYVIVG